MPKAPLDDINALPLDELFRRLTAAGTIRRLLDLARDEDLGPEAIDLTSESIPRHTDASKAGFVVRARAPGILAGLAAVPELFQAFQINADLTNLAADGDRIDHATDILRIEGAPKDITRVERTLLNLLTRLSGVATHTARFVEAIGRAPTRLYDTRKTTPGLRALEKYAVRCGGGHCHRLGLHDAVLIKDNHIAGLTPDELANAITQAAERASARALPADAFGPRPRFIMAEVDTLEQFEAILAAERSAKSLDLVLLDNMTPDQLAQAVTMRDDAASTIQLEASGGITLETIGAIAASGVDRISVGALTRDATGIDFGLDAEPS